MPFREMVTDYMLTDGKWTLPKRWHCIHPTQIQTKDIQKGDQTIFNTEPFQYMPLTL